MATSQLGTWYNPLTKQGYTGPRKNLSDVPADPQTGQPTASVFGSIPTYASTPSSTTPITAPSQTDPATPSPTLAAPKTQITPQATSQVKPQATQQQSMAQQPTPDANISGMPMDVFGKAMEEMRGKLSANDDLVKQKGMLLQQLYDQKLTPNQIKNLTPSQQNAVNSDNRSLIDMEIRLVNDAVSGRANTLDQSIKYLTDTYQQSIDNSEKQKADAQNLVYQFVQQYGSNAGAALKSLYGPEKLQQLKSMGIDVEGFAKANISTINQQRYATSSTGSGFTVDMPQGTIAAQTNNPLNIKYSTTMADMGAVDSGLAAQDGGTFSSFNSPEKGIQAGIQLLQQNYGNLTVEQAMNKWSNGGYGAEVSNLNPNQLISSLSDNQLQKLVGDMAQRESGATVNSSGAVEAVPPDPETANNVDPSTGRTSSAIWNDAIQRAFEGTSLQTFVGGLSSTDPKAKNTKNQIDNTAAAIVTAMGSSYPALKAMYKANASAATKFVTQALFVKTYMSTANDNLDLALSQSQNVPRSGAKLPNNYIQWAQGNFTPAGPLAQFETYIYTASREYAKVTSGGAMSAQGLTDSSQKEAAKLLNAAQSPEAFAATVGAMKQDMNNVIKELDTTVSGFSSTLGLPSTQTPTTGYGAIGGGNASSMSNQDLLNSIPGL